MSRQDFVSTMKQVMQSARSGANTSAQTGQTANAAAQALAALGSSTPFDPNAPVGSTVDVYR